MRVLLVTNLFPTRGAPDSCSFITERLRAHAALGNQVRAVAVSPDFDSTTRAFRGADRIAQLWPAHPNYIRSGGRIAFPELLSLHHRGISRRVASRIAQSVVAQVSGSFDIVHAHGMYAFAAGSVARELSHILEVPFVVSLHGSDVNYRLRRTTARHFRSTLNLSNAVLPVSSALEEALVSKGINRSLCQVLPNGVNLDVFRPRSELGTTSHRRRVAYVGRLEPVKGADRLPAVFRAVASTVRDVAFDIVGTGSLLGALKTSLAWSNVTFHGSLPHDEVAKVMAVSDVLVLPSRNEGWPTVILEAYASGTPVVGTDVGGVREAIANPLFVVPDGADVEQRLADRVIAALHRPPRRSDLVGRAKQFSWARVAEMETDVYRRVLGH